MTIRCLVDYHATFEELQIPEVILGIYRAAPLGKMSSRALLMPDALAMMWGQAPKY
jgi:hypothetical protein